MVIATGMQIKARKPVELTTDAYAISAHDATHKIVRFPIHIHRICLRESPRHIHLDNFCKNLKTSCIIVEKEERNGHEAENAATRDVTRSVVRPRTRMAPTT